jgi:protein-tyrosine-phosphatase
VAEALLKKLRKDLEVKSAGTEPAHRIALNAKELLKEENALAYLKEKPEGLNAKMVAEADLIVVMKEKHKQEIMRRYSSNIGEKIKVWDIEDPLFLPPEHDKIVFEIIKKKVEELARSL